jgi:transmembrane sensor
MNFQFPWFRRNKNRTSDRHVAGWVVRADGGLTEDESRRLENLMKQKQGFEDAFEKSSAAWNMLDNISPELAFESPDARKDRFILFRPFYRELGMVAILALSAWVVLSFTINRNPDNELYFTETRSTIEPWTQRLPDGSMVRLNANTKVEVSFTPKYRRVKLLQGEAHFSVAKMPDRPFRVFAGEVRVQAVGTAFNVRLTQDEVDVLVTEGTVEVASNHIIGEPLIPDLVSEEMVRTVPELVTSGHRAKVLLLSSKPQLEFTVSSADSEIIETSLSWQKSLLTFGGDSLDVIAATFEQKTGAKLIIADSKLHELKIGGQFPSENVKGFLQVLRSGYGIQWFEKSDGTFVIGDNN